MCSTLPRTSFILVATPGCWTILRGEAFAPSCAPYSGRPPLSAACHRSAIVGRNHAMAPRSIPTALHMLLEPAVATTVLGATDAAVSPWSITTVTSDLSAEIFQASLLPYLSFLFFLSRPESQTPKGGTFAFAFLLVFVVATIPAGILAKVQYGEILANVDYLHGLAESFLTITNLLIVNAFRKAVMGKPDIASDDGSTPGRDGNIGTTQSPERGVTNLQSSTTATALAVLAAAPMLLSFVHPEPWNALSFPTWMVHVSSLVEWLVAMAFVWRYADTIKMPEWKGLTWGMVPLHTSGLCACTFHVFYNSPEVNNIVPLQAALTCFGNATMAWATWRVWQAGKRRAAEGVAGAIASSPSSSLSVMGESVQEEGESAR
ncbi:unnamed protein product [Choristocarpus tenellus]